VGLDECSTVRGVAGAFCSKLMRRRIMARLVVGALCWLEFLELGCSDRRLDAETLLLLCCVMIIMSSDRDEVVVVGC